MRAALLIALACATGCHNLDSKCAANATAYCACSDGSLGSQACNTDGTYAACACQGDTVGHCVEGQVVSCLCDANHSGVQTCNAQLTFDPCVCEIATDAGVVSPCAPNTQVACACPDGSTSTQTCNGTGAYGECGCTTAPPVPVSVNTVMEFPAQGPGVSTCIDHGYFWSAGIVMLDALYWDTYIAPTSAGWLVADGYQTQHTFLWDVAPSADGTQMIFGGTIWAAANVPFTAMEGPAPGEWGYHAVALTTHTGVPLVTTYWNGIATGIHWFSNEEHSTPTLQSAGDGTLFVMGADHQTLGGRIAALRGFENATPFAAGDAPEWAFIPELNFEDVSNGAPANFLVDYTQPATLFSDLSPLGFGGGAANATPILHPGLIEVVSPASTPDAGADPPGPAPTWVVDDASPFGKTAPLPTNMGETIPTPVAAPAGALVFDSFSRRAQNFLFQTVPSLGSTESGTLGSMAWNVGTADVPIMPAPFGIMNGRAVFLERQGAIAWVNVEQSDQDVRVQRFTGPSQIGATGIAFRVQDSHNFLYAVQRGRPAMDLLSSQLVFGYFLNGANYSVTNYATANTGWSTLRVVASGANITLMTDDGAGGWTTIGTISSTQFQTATGAGLAGAFSAASATSLWRADLFTVCAIGGCQ